MADFDDGTTIEFFPSFFQFSFVSAETLATACQYMRSDVTEVSGLESVRLLSNVPLSASTERRILTMERRSNFSRRLFVFRPNEPKLEPQPASLCVQMLPKFQDSNPFGC